MSCIVAPGWPFEWPGLWPDFPRSDLGADFASPSDGDGLLEFREFSSPTRPGPRPVTAARHLLAQHRDLPRDITFDNGVHRLARTLYSPEADRPRPCVLIVHGSGACGGVVTLGKLLE